MNFKDKKHFLQELYRYIKKWTHMTRASCQVFPSLSCTPKVNICLDFFFNQRVNMVVWLLSQSRFCNKEDHWVKTCGRLLLQHCPVRSHSSGRGSSCRPSAVRMPLMRANSQAQQPPPFQTAVRASRKFYTDQNVTDTERILPFLVPPSPSISPLNQQQHSWSQ